MATLKKLGLIGCSAIVTGNMMGSGLALLPANLAAIGSITIIGWLIAIVGAIALAYLFSKLGTLNPQEGGLVAYAGEVSPVLGYQSEVLYFHANWIGNLAIAITAIAYLASFFPVLSHPVAAELATIAAIWIFAGINLLGANWIGRLVTIGVALLIIRIVLTGAVGWVFFNPTYFHANWNVSGLPNFHAIINGMLLAAIDPWQSLQWILAIVVANFDMMAFAMMLTLFSNAVASKQQGWAMGISGAVMAVAWVLTGFSSNLLSFCSLANLIGAGGVFLLLSGFVLQRHVTAAART